MLQAEAEWVGRYFAGRDAHDLGTVINIGSSTAEFREHTQPFIHELVFKPLVDRGVPIVHVDIKADAGVNVVANLLKDDDFSLLRQLGAKTVFCSNVLEHVPNPNEFARRLALLVPEGGTLIVTVPSSYPFHPDPIDNGLRPDLPRLASMFVALEPVTGMEVKGPTLLDEFAARPAALARRIARTLLPFPPIGGWLSTVDRWRWLTTPYAAICAVFIAKARDERA